MTARASSAREVAAVLVAVLGAGVVLLVVEPVFGLAVLAGAGAAALLGPRGRRIAAALVALIGVAVVVLGIDRGSVLLAVAGAVVAAAATVAMVRAGRWRRPHRAPAERGTGESSSRDTWDALDRGEDPTA
jgi:hypothetical protein